MSHEIPFSTEFLASQDALEVMYVMNMEMKIKMMKISCDKSYLVIKVISDKSYQKLSVIKVI